ncbi:mitochondrial succinate dehydrogenase cytochrome b560 subunit D [Pseudovirgaria hyperparasitica]|uniref:Succinate dehydrogenase [ubiquinone] cytochrome b small subunit n=1 Tax=Pseudovirgaria hyperparasitica TaxID=470096 RepID=A0A6A6VRC9_9PEZI|nr:mitochondrial succinate dehydrogenase cytochrome b560 subunit D [Pseudovirgaria hyperparasitica]KAF2753152.1 mitochondrial succinate dehydrogenase cytochrome b560 subunit D [Pseudovirgaria hyperparasitica]
MATLARPMALRQALRALPKPSHVAFRPCSTLIQRPLQQHFVKQALQNTTKAVGFHATIQRSILPPEPQTVLGTVNDPAPVPTPSPTHGNYHWSFERLISAGLIPLTIAPFVGGSLNPTLDAVFCATMLVHSHIGFQAILIDYIPIKRMPGVRKFFMWLLNAATVVVGIGLYEFETNDVGVTEAIKKLWHA